MSTLLTTGSLRVSLFATLAASAPGGVAPQGVIQQPSLAALTFVSGVAQALGFNQAGYLSGTLASAANTTIDIYTLGGAIDAIGNAFAMACCKILILQNTGATAGTPLEADTLIIGAAGANPWLGFLNSTGTITLPGTAVLGSGLGGFQIIGAPGVAGFAVPSGAGANVLKLLSGAAANTIGWNLWALGSTS
jgi:hypothetical protein